MAAPNVSPRTTFWLGGQWQFCRACVCGHGNFSVPSTSGGVFIGIFHPCTGVRAMLEVKVICSFVSMSREIRCQKVVSLSPSSCRCGSSVQRNPNPILSHLGIRISLHLGPSSAAPARTHARNPRGPSSGTWWSPPTRSAATSNVCPLRQPPSQTHVCQAGGIASSRRSSRRVPLKSTNF